MKPETYDKLHYVFLALAFMVGFFASFTANYWLLATVPIIVYGAIWTSKQSKKELLKD